MHCSWPRGCASCKRPRDIQKRKCRACCTCRFWDVDIDSPVCFKKMEIKFPCGTCGGWEKISMKLEGHMTAKELAHRLNGKEYGEVISREEQDAAKSAGLVVAYGYSDDLLEFAGAIFDEVGAYGGGTALLKNGQLIVEPNCGVEADSCKLYQEYIRTSHKVTAVWHEEGSPCWTIETGLPHETFNIYEEGQVFSLGIVFWLADTFKERLTDQPVPIL